MADCCRGASDTDDELPHEGGNVCPEGGRGAEHQGGKQHPSTLLVFCGFVVAMLLAVLVRLTRPPQGPCVYHHAYRRATCKVKGLQSIPVEVPDSLQTLIIGDELDESAQNYFSVLNRVNVSRFRHLQELSLVRCGVTDVEPESFADLVHLRKLDLSHNGIQVINESTFKGLLTLDLLRLSNNPIYSIPDFTFRGISIKQLTFSNNRQLAEISVKAFADALIESLTFGRCALETLQPSAWSLDAEFLRELSVTDNLHPLGISEDALRGFTLNRLVLCRNGISTTEFLRVANGAVIVLDGNSLTRVDSALTPRNRTRVLSLGGNRLTKITRENLTAFPNLEILNVSGNDIKLFDADAFSDSTVMVVIDFSRNGLEEFRGNFTGVMPRLDTLLLNDNDIEVLPGEVGGLLRRLSVLSLANNPFHCNCELRWLVEWLGSAGRVFKELLDTLTCTDAGSGNLTQFAENEFKCRAPTITNTSFDLTARTLLCTAEGDPAPSIIWSLSPPLPHDQNFAPPGDTQWTTVPPKAERSVFETEGRLIIQVNGNYTCRAVNVVGEDSVRVDTGGDVGRVMESGRTESSMEETIEIVSTPAGCLLTLLLLAALGYIFRHQ